MMSEFEDSVTALRPRRVSLSSVSFKYENGDLKKLTDPNLGRNIHPESPEKYLMKQLRRNIVSMHDAAGDGLLETIRNRAVENPSNVQEKDEGGLCPLHHAARNNKRETLILLLDLGADIESRGEQGFSPLHVAVRFNSIDVAEELLRRGADPSSRTDDCFTPLHFAARFGNRAVVKLIAQHRQTDIDATDKRGWTALHYACARKDEEICEMLLNFGARVDVCTQEKVLPLHLATMSKEAAIAELIITAAYRQGIDVKRHVESEDIETNRPLQWAIKTNNRAVIELLFRHGTSSNTRKWNLQTPLHLAAACGNTDLVELLIDREALVNCKDSDRVTPLHCAASNGHVEVVQVLLDNDAKLESRDRRGMTPFLCAVNARKVVIAKLIVDYGCDVTVQEKCAKSCLHLAVENDDYAMLVFLLNDACAESDLVNKVDKRGRSPLHYSAAKECPKTFEILLASNADASLADDSRRTPLHVAAEQGKTRHVEQLVLVSPTSITAREESGYTPLHLAALNGETKTCALLLKMGSELHSFDDNHWTPLMCSVHSGSFQTAEFLIKLDAAAASESRDNEGNTALHIAARHNEEEIVKLLLDNQCIVVLNNEGQSFLGVAMQHNCGDVVMRAVKHRRWREIITVQGYSDGYPLEDLIKSFPEATEVVLDRCVQNSKHKPTDKDYSVTYDFRLLDPGPDSHPMANGERFFGLLNMIKHNHEVLIGHPLSRQLYNAKWIRFGRPIYLLNLFIYLLFLILLTSFLLTQRGAIRLPGKHDSYDDEIFEYKIKITNVMARITLIFAAAMMLKELWQLMSRRLRYFTDLSNVLEWGVYLTAFFFILPYAFDVKLFEKKQRYTWQIGTISVMLGYLNLVLFTRPLPYIGLYVSMFLEVMKTFTRAMGLLAMFVLGYSLVFFILFKEQDAFDNYGLSIVKTTVMMVGEFDYTNILVDVQNSYNNKTGAPYVPFPEVSYVFFYLFVITMSVALMNLLVGLAVGDIDAIRKTAYMRKKAIQIQLVADVENKYPRFITRRLYKPLVVYQPNKSGCGMQLKGTHPDLFCDVDLEEDRDWFHHNEAERYRELKKELGRTKLQLKHVISSLDHVGEVLKEVAAKLELNTRRGSEVEPISPRRIPHVTFDVASDQDT